MAMLVLIRRSSKYGQVMPVPLTGCGTSAADDTPGGHAMDRVDQESAGGSCCDAFARLQKAATEAAAARTRAAQGDAPSRPQGDQPAPHSSASV